MKKLMLAIAIAVMSIAANAASFKWTAANVYGSSGTKWSGAVSLYAYAATADISTATVVDTFSITTAGSVSSTFNSAALTGGNYYNFYFVIEDNGKTFTSATKENVQALATQTANISFGNMASATQNAANWKGSSPVPEPTSGLLLLLGVAGLTLKRKRA